MIETPLRSILTRGAVATFAVLATLAFATATPLSAQTPATSKPRPAQDAAKKVEWPKPTAKQKSRSKLLIRKLIKQVEAGDEDSTETEAELIELGPAIGRDLLRRLGNSDVAEEGHPELERVLDAVLADEHAPLLIPYLKKKQIQVRRYVVARMAAAHHPAVQATLGSLLKNEDEDESVRFGAALGLAGMKDFDHFDVVFERCKARDWRTIAPFVAKVLEKARSSEARSMLAERMRDADTQSLVTSLRLMRSLCPKDLAGTIKSWLDSQENTVKREAINALRAIVDGDPPLENLTAFQAIDHSKKWKARL